MSFLNVATPAAIEFADLAMPLLAVSIVGTIFLVFEPLLTGLLRAAILVVKPRQTRDERRARTTLLSMLTLNRMADEADGRDPALAAELRSIAARA